MRKRREWAGRKEEEGRWVMVMVTVTVTVRMYGTANMVRLAVVVGERSPLGDSVANIY